MGKRDTSAVFRVRLQQVIAESGLSRTAFADRLGTDRSTLSQLLSEKNLRLPRAETIAAIARQAHVSVDWLLGLTQEDALATGLLEETVALEPRVASPADEQLRQWHAEATGYKIRYVPTTLPDLLKTEAVIRYEYRVHETVPPEGRIEQSEDRLAYSRRPETDMEVCSSFQGLEGFALGQGLWKGLSVAARLEQIDVMVALLDELYPTLRWFLFDGLQRYAAPLTIFGPKRAAIYLGDMYLVSTSTEHIQTLTRNFDNLIRVAVTQPPEVPGYLRRLRARIDPRG